jgi:hypothetical protein
MRVIFYHHEQVGCIYIWTESAMSVRMPRLCHPRHHKREGPATSVVGGVMRSMTSEASHWLADDTKRHPNGVGSDNMEQWWVYSFCIAYRHPRNRAKTRRCVAKVVGNRVFSGHTCKKSGENLWVCGENGRKLGHFRTHLQEIRRKLVGV